MTLLTHLSAPAPGTVLDGQLGGRQRETEPHRPALTPVTRLLRARSRALAAWVSVPRLPVAMVLVDLVAIAVSLVLIEAAGIGLGPTIALLLPPLWLLLLAANRAYRSRHTGTGFLESSRRVARSGAALAVACLAVAALADLPAGPGQLLFVAGAFTGTSLAPRSAAGLWTTLRGTTALARTRVVLVGHHAKDIRRTMDELARTHRSPYEVVAVCLTKRSQDPYFEVPVHVGHHRISEIVAGSDAHAVMVLPCNHLEAAELRRIGWELEQTRTQLFVGTPLVDVAGARTSVAAAGGLRMLHVANIDRRGPTQLLKSVLEPPAALLLLLLLSPLLIAVALAIKVDSPGPVVYRQGRIGRAGRTFTMYKFRTMRTDADQLLHELQDDNEVDAVLFKMRSDPRITRVGAIVRRYSLDELPQLVNVVLGQMSLVGPRPALPSEAEMFCQDAQRRLVVKPGLTGLWQVSGRSDLSWEETVRLDMRYVDNWSLSLDFAILCRTIHAVLSHRGAY